MPQAASVSPAPWEVKLTRFGGHPDLGRQPEGGRSLVGHPDTYPVEYRESAVALVREGDNRSRRSLVVWGSVTARSATGRRGPAQARRTGPAAPRERHPATTPRAGGSKWGLSVSRSAEIQMSAINVGSVRPPHNRSGTAEPQGHQGAGLRAQRRGRARRPEAVRKARRPATAAATAAAAAAAAAKR